MTPLVQFWKDTWKWEKVSAEYIPPEMYDEMYAIDFLLGLHQYLQLGFFQGFRNFIQGFFLEILS